VILLALGSRLLIGGLLLVGGAAKLAAGDAYRRRWLDSYFKLPSSLSGPLAAAFSFLEVSVGSAYLLGFSRSVFGWLTAALLTVITGVVAVTLIRGRKPACGCAGTLSDSLASWRLVIRNAVFIGVSAGVAYFGAADLGLGSAPLVVALPAWAATGTAAFLIVDWLARRRSTALSGRDLAAPELGVEGGLM
jgi:hypothetical protein